MSDETPPEDKPKKRVIGKPFVKGDPRCQRGGTRYRNEAGVAIIELCRGYAPRAFERVVEIMEDPATRPADVIKGAVAIWNRGLGLPNLHIRHEANVTVDHTTINPTQLSAEVRRALLEARRQATADEPLLIEDASFTDVNAERPDE